MNNRMEKVAERIALGALRRVGALVVPARSMEEVEKDFHSRWPSEFSRFPLSDARKVALVTAIAGQGEALSRWDHEGDGGKTPIAHAWDLAANEAVEEYFDNAQVSFERKGLLEGAETLTDAVRAALGCIAVGRGWPHSSDDDLFRVAAALATGGNFPQDDENLYVLLDEASDEGMDLCGALGASMGRPYSIRCGLYTDGLDGVQDEARQFARTTIDLANRLAGKRNGGSLNQEEHIRTAQELSARADEELRSGGNQLVAAELMWGAFAHCLIARAINEGMHHSSHEEFRLVAQHLAASRNLERWQSDFGAAEGLHVHFYHGNLTLQQLHTHAQNTRRATVELLGILQAES